MFVGFLIVTWLASTAALAIAKGAPDAEYVRLLSSAPRFFPTRAPDARTRLARRYAIAVHMASAALACGAAALLVALVVALFG